MTCKTLLQVRLTPRAKTTGVHGMWNNTHWRISVQAPAIEGRANEALIQFLSSEFHLPQSFFQIISGQNSRCKTVEIRGNPMISWKK